MSKKIIANIFNYATQEGARDIVIEKLPKKISINYVFPDGETRSFGLPEKLEDDFRSNLRQILSLTPEDLLVKKHFKIKNKTGCFNFYLSVFPSQDGGKMIVNLIQKEHKALRLRQLGLKSDDIRTMQAAIKHRSGLILISSPACQGKGTTLYALLRELDISNRSSYFLGDGFEYHIDGLNCLANTKSNWNKVLSLDSDVIITEITKEENLREAFMAATSGRLVLATIEANSVWEVILAVLKLKLPLNLKLDSLRLITAQRLAPLKRTKLEMAKHKAGDRQNIGLFELLTISPKMKEFIAEKENKKNKENFWEDLSRLALKSGYEPLSSDKERKIKNGLI